MINDKIVPKNSGHKGAYIAAVDMLASDLTLTYKDIANKIGVHPKTLMRWLKNGDFIDSVYKGYMEVAGVHIPSVVQAMIEEARLGNVHAARLILEHFGKLENKLKIQVESNFEKFMKTDAKEVEFFEVTEDQNNTLDLLSEHVGIDIELPERDDSNDDPDERKKAEKKNLKKRVSSYARAKRTTDKQKQNERYAIRRRAEKVGLELLSPGRHTKTIRDRWMEKLEELENTS